MFQQQNGLVDPKEAPLSIGGSWWRNLKLTLKTKQKKIGVKNLNVGTFPLPELPSAIKWGKDT